jgi:hypothetical protein
MLNRITVTLSDRERDLLRVLSEKDLRYPADELRFALLQEARRRDLLPLDEPESAHGDMRTSGDATAAR